MRKCKSIPEILILAIFLSGFTTGEELKIAPGADFKKYKKVAVINFEDAPDSPNSGNLVSKIVASELKKKGFDILEAEGVKGSAENLSIKRYDISISELEELRETFGVDAVVCGKVSRYESKVAGGLEYYHRPADPRQAQFPTRRFFYLISIELKMLDSKTGDIIMEAKDHVQETSNLGLIEDMTKRIVKRMFKKLPKIK